MGSSSRILVIGGTGMMGQHLVKASLAAGHPTAVLVRPAASKSDAADPSKRELLEAIKASGATVIGGDIYDHDSLVAAFKQVDVVISAVGHHGPHDLEDGQLRIVAAIKEAGGNVRRFVPSEYGCDVEQVPAAALLEPARSILQAKVRVRHAIRGAGIPHTFICSYWAHGFVLPRLGDPHIEGPPASKATVFGDDDTRVIFVNEGDMAAVTVRAVDDPRALNKILYVRPGAGNTCSLAHLVRLWEDKTGRVLDKYYMPQEELVARIRDSPMPLNFQLAMVHATVAARVCDQTVVHGGVDATELYPDIKYVTVHDFLDALALKEGLTVTVNA